MGGGGVRQAVAQIHSALQSVLLRAFRAELDLGLRRVRYRRILRVHSRMSHPSVKGIRRMISTSAIRTSLFLLLVGCAALSAEDGGVKRSDEAGGSALHSWGEKYAGIAAKYDFRLSDDPDEKLKFHPRPVQVYHRPTGGREMFGAFFVWTRKGRPEVVGSLWSYKVNAERRNLAHEFDSFAQSPLVETEIGGVPWTPKSIIRPQAIPDAPVPAASPRLRLAQIRQMAKQFTGYSDNGGKKETRLRLLPQPLYYAQSKGDKVTDCALFCFFADWDPDIILLIEARGTADGPRWHFSAARFNNVPMHLDYANNEIWKMEWAHSSGNVYGDPSGSFFAVHESSALPAELEGEKKDSPKD